MIETESRNDLVGRFREDGFAVVADLADRALLNEMRAVYDGMLDGSIPCPGTDRELGGLTRQIMQPHAHHSLFARNATLDRAKEIAAELIGCDDPEFFFSMLIYKPAGHPHETPWHMDMAYAKMPMTPAGTSWPNDVVAQFWLALDDVDDDMGCMEFIPGVQGRSMPPHRVASGKPDDDGRLLAIVDPAAALPIDRAVRCPLRAGSATVHGYSAPHYTGPNRSDRGRRAYIFSFADMKRLTTLLAK
ncbi:phytanoyl-CoA dioxygenase family protein [Bradyrhizobium sp. INPA03-11B]|uniref:phytanoyl-CoA dioxygenase family protein n=1 Tax=Bradyrhizobium sp. INPA03-11B TaxID=418598 RepID=UPI00338DBFDC